jgi:hypothetical protein
MIQQLGCFGNEITVRTLDAGIWHLSPSPREIEHQGFVTATSVGSEGDTARSEFTRLQRRFAIALPLRL